MTAQVEAKLIQQEIIDHMSSPTLNSSVFVETVARTLPESKSERSGADAALTARAVMAVSVLGAGSWYLLWKIALFFVVGH